MNTKLWWQSPSSHQCKLYAFNIFNTLRSWQNRRHFVDDIFKSIFLNENARISLKISLKFVPKVRINNIPALVQIMAWRWPGDKPLSEPMMVSLLTHICVTWPQWVHSHWTIYKFSKVYQIDNFFHQITHSKMHTTACIESIICKY